MRRRAWLLAASAAWATSRTALAAAPGPASGAASAASAGSASATASAASSPSAAISPADTPAPEMRPRPLAFPRDHGAHVAYAIEWWYATGWLRGASGDDLCGFQLTFFRARTGLGERSSSRFAPRQLLFAHAAITDLRAGRLLHAQRVQRWSGDEAAALAAASANDTRVNLRDWQLAREPHGGYRARLLNADAAADARFGFALTLTPTQGLLLHGDAGFSRKGPEPSQASHYYSQPQLEVSGELQRAGGQQRMRGRAWLDHEWSQAPLPRGAVGWDWIGINLDDGAALMAFVLRRADGSALWAGGTHRGANGHVRVFRHDEVRFTPGRRWASPATRASYPVQWRVQTPAGSFEVWALLDAQELDSRGSTGAVYWEGLSELRDAPSGRRVGLGYLEMTGYAAPLRLPGA